jgi:hypothetical protein
MVATAGCVACVASPSSAGDFVTMEAIKDKDYGKTPMKFSDFEISQSGVQYKDLIEGSGAVPQTGDTCVIDWQGYTVGYYGRVFEARNKVRTCHLWSSFGLSVKRRPCHCFSKDYLQMLY